MDKVRWLLSFFNGISLRVFFLRKMLEQRHATCIEEKWMLIAAVKVNGLPSEFRSAEEIYRQRWKSFHLHQLRNSKAVDSHKVRLIGPFVFLVSSLAVFRPRLLASGWMFTEGAKETERRARDKERVQRWINYREAHAQRGTENEKKKNEREKHKRNEKSLSSYSPRGGWVHTGGSATGHVVASCNSPAHEYKIIRNTWRFVACVYPTKKKILQSKVSIERLTTVVTFSDLIVCTGKAVAIPTTSGSRLASHSPVAISAAQHQKRLNVRGQNGWARLNVVIRRVTLISSKLRAPILRSNKLGNDIKTYPEADGQTASTGDEPHDCLKYTKKLQWLE